MSRILILSMAPVFPRKVHGGSQKILAAIACHLGKCGNQVKVICTARPNLPATFTLEPGVTVEAQLSFKQPFPDPFRAPPSRVALSLEKISTDIANSDIVYMHDGAFCPVATCQDRPLVVSIRDFFYSESIVGLFSFRRDILLLNSAYASDVVLSLLGGRYEGLAEKTRIIPNGIDTSTFFPVNRAKAKASLGLGYNRNCLLFPHRTVPEKGGAFLVRTIQELERRGWCGLDVVMPVWIDAGRSLSGDNEVDGLKQLWRENELQTNLALIPWVNQEHMRVLYSAADVTLCLGNAPEAFGGNVALESLVCRTPVVATSVGAYSNTIPSRFLHRVGYGLEQDAADCIEAAIAGSKKPTESEVQEIASLFDFKKMLKGYQQAICGAHIVAPIRDRHVSKWQNGALRLAPWCNLHPFGYYHDFEREYYPSDALHEFLVGREGSNFTIPEALSSGVSFAIVENAVELGLVISVLEDCSTQGTASLGGYNGVVYHGLQ